jgi:hypothetical protein
MPEQKVLLSRSEIVIFVAEDRHGMGWMMSVQGLDAAIVRAPWIYLAF